MRWMRVVAGAALLGVALLVGVTTASALLANHWLYPALLALALVVGMVLLVTGLRTPAPPRPGRVRTVLRVAAMLAGIGAAAVLLWLEPFVATDRALAAMTSDSTVTVTESRSSITFAPSPPTGRHGLVLYPGARVDPRAYAVLARGIAAAGHPVVVLKCPLDLALLCGDPGPGDAAHLAGAWAVGGHSLGGVQAARVVEGKGGLVLWASYPVDDLSGSTLPAASISASNDGLSTPEKVAAAAHLLPPGTQSTVVGGAVHAFFGDYGDQPGDGVPTVSREEAQRDIIEATVALLDQRLLGPDGTPQTPGVVSLLLPG